MPAGRPEKPINPAMFEMLMGIHFVTAENIADVLGVSVKTIKRFVKKEYGCNFDHLRKQKRAGMKLRLAGKQYELAMKGNVAMAIFLGKQWLGQADKVETQNETKVIADVEYVSSWGNNVETTVSDKENP